MCKVLMAWSNDMLHILSDFLEQSVKKLWQINFLWGDFFFPGASMCFESGTSPLTQHYSSQIQSLPSPCLPEVFLSAAFSKHTWSFSFKIIFNPPLGNQDQPTLVWARKEQPGPTYSAAPPSQTLKLCLQAPRRVRLFWFIKPCQGPSGALPVLSKFYMVASRLLAWAKSETQFRHSSETSMDWGSTTRQLGCGHPACTGG